MAREGRSIVGQAQSTRHQQGARSTADLPGVPRQPDPPGTAGTTGWSTRWNARAAISASQWRNLSATPSNDSSTGDQAVMRSASGCAAASSAATRLPGSAATSSRSCWRTSMEEATQIADRIISHNAITFDGRSLWVRASVRIAFRPPQQDATAATPTSASTAPNTPAAASTPLQRDHVPAHISTDELRATFVVSLIALLACNRCTRQSSVLSGPAGPSSTPHATPRRHRDRALGTISPAPKDPLGWRRGACSGANGLPQNTKC